MTSAPTTSTDRTGRFAVIVAWLGAVFLIAVGLYAMVAPSSFFDTLATFEPYNRHFIQDIGAFQIGLGAVLALAAARPVADALAVALVGVSVGAIAHLVSHLIGMDLGGTPATDIPFFALLAALLLVAGLVRWRSTD